MPLNAPIPAGTAASRSTANRRYFAPIKAKSYVGELVDIGTKVDTDQKTGEPILKLNFKFAVLIAGADDPAKREKARAAGYGKFLWYDPTVKITPPGENTRESNLHLLLKNLVNGGRDLTPAQIASFYLEGVSPRQIDPAKLNALIGKQIELVVGVKDTKKPLIGDDGKPVAGAFEQRNFIKEFNPLDEEDYLPAYTAEWGQAPVDPKLLEARAKNDDPSIKCSVTGQPITGYFATVDSDEYKAGDYISNTAWAAFQLSKFGSQEFSFPDRPGETFRAPFGPRYYRSAKEQMAQLTVEAPF